MDEISGLTENNIYMLIHELFYYLIDLIMEGNGYKNCPFWSKYVFFFIE